MRDSRSPLTVHPIPVLTDNYVYLVHDKASGATAAVDPSLDGPVLAALERLGWRLDVVLLTHHHGDHTGGVAGLKRATRCQVVAGRLDASRIPEVDRKVDEGDTIELGEARAKVLHVPGHTRGHVAYWFEAANVLFSGDTLFSLGCGRLFEGSAAEMWESLQKLRALPDATLLYCAHEYTNANADFALTIEPDNPALVARADAVLELRQKGLPSLPTTLGEEKAANPFLRADLPELRRAAGLEGLGGAEAFARLRARKDVF